MILTRNSSTRNPLAATVAEPPKHTGVFEFMGFTTGTVYGRGDDGSGDLKRLVGMLAEYQADFGPDERMCAMEEFFFRSSKMAFPSVGKTAWTQMTGAASSAYSAGPPNCRG